MRRNGQQLGPYKILELLPGSVQTTSTHVIDPKTLKHYVCKDRNDGTTKRLYYPTSLQERVENLPNGFTVGGFPSLTLIERKWISFEILYKYYQARVSKSGEIRIHGDIRPENIFVNSALDVSIVDDSNSTRPRDIKDAYDFLSFASPTISQFYLPSQAVSNYRQTVKQRNYDFFALGCVIYYVFTGEHLFTFHNHGGYDERKIREKIPPQFVELVIQFTKNPEISIPHKYFEGVFKCFPDFVELHKFRDNNHYLNQNIVKAFEEDSFNWTNEMMIFKYRIVENGLFCDNEVQTYPQLLQLFIDTANQMDIKFRMENAIPALLARIGANESRITAFQYIAFQYLQQLFDSCLSQITLSYMNIIFEKLLYSMGVSFIELIPEFFTKYQQKMAFLNQVDLNIDPHMQINDTIKFNCIEYASPSLFYFLSPHFRNLSRSADFLYEFAIASFEKSPSVPPRVLFIIKEQLQYLKPSNYFDAVKLFPKDNLIKLEAMARASEIFARHVNEPDDLIAARLFLRSADFEVKEHCFFTPPHSIPKREIETQDCLASSSIMNRRMSMQTAIDLSTVGGRFYRSTRIRCGKKIDSLIAFPTGKSFLAASGGMFYFVNNYGKKITLISDQYEQAYYNNIAGSTTIDSKGIIISENSLYAFDEESLLSTTQISPYYSFSKACYHKDTQIVAADKRMGVVIFDIEAEKESGKISVSNFPTNLSEISSLSAWSGKNVFILASRDGSVSICDSRIGFPISNWSVPLLSNEEITNVKAIDPSYTYLITTNQRTLLMNDDLDIADFLNVIPSFINVSYGNTYFMQPYSLLRLNTMNPSESVAIFDGLPPEKWDAIKGEQPRGVSLHRHAHPITAAASCTIMVSGDSKGFINFYNPFSKAPLTK